MDECDLEPEEALPRLGVDQLRAFLGEPRERSAEVPDLVGDVVHSGAALRDEPADWRVVAERAEQLDAAVADEQRGGFDALVGNRFAVLDTCIEEPLVRLDGVAEVLDRDAEVMDAAGLHHRDAIGAARGRASRPR